MYKVVDHSSSQVAIKKKHFIITAIKDKDLANSIEVLVIVSITVVAIAVTRI